MHILIIPRGYPSHQRPQNGNFEVDQAEGLVKLGHTVSMISIDLGRQFLPGEYGIHRVAKNGVLSYNICLFPSKFFPGHGLYAKWFHFLLDYLYKQVVKELGKPDIIYAHYLWNMDWGLSLKYKYQIPLVGIEHWSEMGYEQIKPAIERHARRIYAQVDGLITVSHSLQRNIEKHFGIQSKVVFDTIHDSVRMSGETRAKDGLVRFVSVGSLIPRKGYDDLITAFAHSSIPKDKWVLRIAGEGIEEKNLQVLIKQFNLANNIFLIGTKTKPEIVALLNQSDVFISSSHLETFGVAALEAICCGVPVLAIDSVGPREFITEHNGRICEDNQEALRHGIEYMFAHYTDFDKQKLADDAVNKFSSSAIAQQLESIFNHVLANK